MVDVAKLGPISNATRMDVHAIEINNEKMKNSRTNHETPEFFVRPRLGHMCFYSFKANST